MQQRLVHGRVNLYGVSKQAYLGLVFQPERIIYKMRTGKSYGIYAEFEL